MGKGGGGGRNFKSELLDIQYRGHCLIGALFDRGHLLDMAFYHMLEVKHC